MHDLLRKYERGKRRERWSQSTINKNISVGEHIVLSIYWQASIEKKADEVLQVCLIYILLTGCSFLPARASEQGNVIGSVRIYITEKPFTSK